MWTAAIFMSKPSAGIPDSPTGKVGCDDREVRGEPRQDRPPHARRLRVAVQQDHRRTVPRREVVQLGSLDLRGERRDAAVCRGCVHRRRRSEQETLYRHQEPALPRDLSSSATRRPRSQREDRHRQPTRRFSLRLREARVVKGSTVVGETRPRSAGAREGAYMLVERRLEIAQLRESCWRAATSGTRAHAARGLRAGRRGG